MPSGGDWIAGGLVLTPVAGRPDPGQRHPANVRRAGRGAPAGFAQRPSERGGGGWIGGGRAGTAKSVNGDKDPIEQPAAGLRPGERTVRWPWGGMKGRLCGTTISGGYRSGVAEPGTWQAVLAASNAVAAGKSWTLLGSRLPLAERNTGGWPD
jgi:hypothetical protein